MFGQLLLFLGSVHIGVAFAVVFEEASRRLGEKVINKYNSWNWKIGGEDRISALPEDLLVRILLHVPAQDAVATMILSKRWRYVWTMVPKLEYPENNEDTQKIVIGGLLGRLLGRLFGKRERCMWRLINESLKVHKAHILESLAIECPQCPDDVDVGMWITNAVNRKVRELGFSLTWSAEPTSLPNRLYRCDSLRFLGLAGKVLVDIPSLACLPSLEGLALYSVVYKDEDSLARLLSSCPILKKLIVVRHQQDNVKSFSIKVPSLEILLYQYKELGAQGSWVIDSPALKKILITDYTGYSCSFQNKLRLDKARIHVLCFPDSNFKRSLSSLMYLELGLNVVTLAWFDTINFSQLVECKITLLHELDWLEPLMHFLQHSPNLKVLFIDEMLKQVEEEWPLSWKQPSSVPGCLSNHLEIFEWKGYKGRSNEKEFVRYIFANSKCLKRAGFSFKSKFLQRWKKKELNSMSRVSKSSQLLFSTQLEYTSIKQEFSDY